MGDAADTIINQVGCVDNEARLCRFVGIGQYLNIGVVGRIWVGNRACGAGDIG